MSVPERSYDGAPLDHRYQHIAERPVQPGREPAGETVYATDPDPEGECRTEDVVLPDEVEADAADDAEETRPQPSDREPVDVPEDTEQTTLGGWSG